VKPPFRYLWVLRHAKAASEAPWGGSDKDRPLTARGRGDASALGQRLAADPIDLRFDRGGRGATGPGAVTSPDRVLRPELAVCSAAVRTRQTADLIVDALGGEIPINAFRSLYSAEADLVLQYVREVDEGVDSLLVVGHNPAVFEVAWQLLADPAAISGAVQTTAELSDRDLLEAHGFPTCALAVISLEVGAWEDVAHGCGTLVGVFKPPY